MLPGLDMVKGEPEVSIGVSCPWRKIAARIRSEVFCLQEQGEVYVALPEQVRAQGSVKWRAILPAPPTHPRSSLWRN